MSHTENDAQALADLRQRAVFRLTAGSRPSGRLSNASEALSVLHELASSPSTAGDALALLHELQVHQVEVDLQNEELRNSRAELELALRRQAALFDLAPVGMLVVDDHSVLQSVNRIGAQWLGRDVLGLAGQSMLRLLSPASVDAWNALLALARRGTGDTSCSLTPGHGGAARGARAAASFDADTGRCTVVVMPM